MESNRPWVVGLRSARELPELHIGYRDPMVAIKGTVEVCLKSEAFSGVSAVRLWVSDFAYLAQAIGGPLRAEIAAMMPWDETDLLSDALITVGGVLQSRSVHERKKWLRPFTDIRFGLLAAPFRLAERAVLGVRTPDGTWCQTLHQGWPTTAPFLSEVRADMSLVVGAELSPRWFTHLPLDPARIRSVLGETVMQRVELGSLAADIVSLPETTVRPAIESWLQQLPGAAP